MAGPGDCAWGSVVNGASADGLLVRWALPRLEPAGAQAKRCAPGVATPGTSVVPAVARCPRHARRTQNVEGDRHGIHAELTMLFTDIEGSTTLLEPPRSGLPRGPRGAPRRPADRLPQERRARARHRGRQLLRRVRRGGGRRGPPRPRGSAPWSRTGGRTASPLRVRMGLHTGHAEPFEDNLVGFDVHLAARISATAHGGQVVAQHAHRRPGLGPAARGRPRSSVSGCTGSRTSPTPSTSGQLIVPGLPRRLPLAAQPRGPGSLPTAADAARRPRRRDRRRWPRSSRRRRAPAGDAHRARRHRQDPARPRGGADAVARPTPHGVHFVDLSGATETLGRLVDGGGGARPVG